VSETFDPSNPFGGPIRKKMDFRMVELMLSVVDNGRELYSSGAVPAEEKEAHLEQLHRLHAQARGMVWRELSRRKKRAQEGTSDGVDERDMFEGIGDEDEDF